MRHLTDLQLSMYADDALPADEVGVAARHVESCAQCQAKLAAAKGEVRMLAQAMADESLDTLPELGIPKFSRPTSLRNFALANIATGLVIWLAGFLWKTLFSELAMNAATWLTATYLPDIYEMTSATALYYLKEGTAMFDAYLGLIVLSLSAFTALGLLLMYRRHHASASLCLFVLMGATLVAPAPVNALEIMRDEEGVLTIAADEIIDDTLIIVADRVVVKGKITGDLLTFGRRIDVEGTVDGNLMAFGESVTVAGTVGGRVTGAGSSFDVSGAQVGGDLWAAGAKVIIDGQSRIARNGMVAGESVSLEGFVGKDLYAFGESVELSGELGEDLEAFGNRIRLLDDAHVSGDARLRVEKEDNVYREDGARIDGKVEFLDLPEELEETSRYASIEFYLWQIARLVSAVLVGLALFWLIPSFRTVSVGGGVEGLKSAGIGLVTLVSGPAIALILAITLVGFPFAVVAVFAWLMVIYLGKIMVGAFVGRILLSGTKYSDKLALVLLAGMAAVIVIINIPAIGGFISFVLTIIGIGLIVQRLLAALSTREANSSI